MTEKQIEKELQRQAVLFEEKCRNGQFVGSSIKFADFADMWIKEYGEKNLKAKTLTRYKILLVRINKAIGHIKLSSLQPMQLMAFYSNLAEEGVREDTRYTATKDLSLLFKDLNITKTEFSNINGLSVSTLNQALNGKKINLSSAEKISAGLNCKLNDFFTADESKKTLSPQTIRHHHRLISAILQTAVIWQVIPSNPCARLKPPAVPHKESRYLEDYEVKQLFVLLDNKPIQYKTAIVLFIYSGMRRGELCGLKWSDIDFDKKPLKYKDRFYIFPPKDFMKIRQRM